MAPEQAYRVLKRRLLSLGVSPQLSRLRSGQLLSAICHLIGYASFDAVKADLPALHTGKTYSESQSWLHWLVHVLDSDLSGPAGLPAEDWARLEEFLKRLAGQLSLKESAVLNAAAIAWCTAPEWSTVEQRRLRYAQALRSEGTPEAGVRSARG